MRRTATIFVSERFFSIAISGKCCSLKQRSGGFCYGFLSTMQKDEMTCLMFRNEEC